MIDTILNWIILRSPAWIQIIFMERVMKSVKASRFSEKKKANQVLFSKKEGRLRTGRRYRPSNPFRTPRMDLLDLQRIYQSASEDAKLYGSHRGTHYSARSGRHAHVG